MRTVGTLFLTHSSRRTNLERCSHDFLSRRFGAPNRLADLPPLTRLPPAVSLYSGSLSCWRVAAGRDGRLELRSLGSLRHRDKIQHAVLDADGYLLVGFEHRVERWEVPMEGGVVTALRTRDVRVTARFEHPWLAGLHTVEPLPGGRLAVACSAPDAVLELDGEGRLVAAHRMPSKLYGEGFELTPATDLRRHYIDDEHQICHLNAAYPVDGGRGLVVSTLIQGAIGRFDRASGDFSEIHRGRPGSHGARVDRHGRVYFTDSTAGAVVFLDDGGAESGRFEVGSRWLHDAVQLRGSLYAFALADFNELRIYDVDDGSLHFRHRFKTWPVEGLFGLARRWPGWLGNSTQALSFYPPRSSSSAHSPK